MMINIRKFTVIWMNEGVEEKKVFLSRIDAETLMDKLEDNEIDFTFGISHHCVLEEEN